MKCRECKGRKQNVKGQMVCIECLARVGRRRRWSKEEEDILFDLYGAKLPAAIRLEIYKRTGRPRTVAAVIVHAGQLGLDHRTNQAATTIPEVARELGVTRDVIYGVKMRGFLRTEGHGKVHLLPDSEVEFLKQVFPPKPARSISGPEAGKRLGYGSSHMTRLLKAGAIRAVKRGHRWYVDEDHVDELVRQMKQTGAVALDWSHVRELDREREKFKDQVPKRRERRRLERQTLWYTKADARRVLGVKREEMTRLLEQGLVRGKRENDLWLAERAHVDELAAAKQGEAM